MVVVGGRSDTWDTESPCMYGGRRAVRVVICDEWCVCVIHSPCVENYDSTLDATPVSHGVFLSRVLSVDSMR